MRGSSCDIRAVGGRSDSTVFCGELIRHANGSAKQLGGSLHRGAGIAIVVLAPHLARLIACHAFGGGAE